MRASESSRIMLPIFSDLWEGTKIALQALRANKLRFLLTTLGIVIGVMTVITIVALIQGINQAFYEEISSIGTDTLYIQKFAWVNNNEEDWVRFRNRKDITLREYEAVVKHATLVKAVTPSIYTRAAVRYKDNGITGVLIAGTNDNYMVTSNTAPERGRFISTQDVDYRRNVCVLGAEVAEKLFGRADPLGERISIGGRRFRIVGVLAERGKIFGFNPNVLVVIPFGTFENAFGHRRSVEIQVKVNHPALLDAAQDELTGILRRVRKVPPHKEDDFAINRQSLLTNLYNSLTAGLWGLAIGVGSISLLVGGIGIMNIMLVSVTERTREIGIRKAIGAKRRDILWQFLVETMIICSLGVVLGILAAVGVAFAVKQAFSFPVVFTPWIILLGLGFVVTIGLFFGIYPASKAARLNPTEALRYE
ncbi:MAG: Macrolide export ATP-binding/permease protein MacB [bacterium]|nr:Macrolide export ATP-binding/permease protein MacB [bacterium]